MMTLRQTLDDIKNDFPNPKITLKSFLLKYFFSPGFRVLLNYRIGRYLSQNKTHISFLLIKYYKYRLTVKRNCDLSYNAIIGKNFTMPHPLGIVIGDQVKIGNNVKIWQQVTVGSHGKKNKAADYPIIEDDVRIFSGAKIIGGIKIGKGVIIGANSVVLKDVPPYSVAVGIPAKVINKITEENESI